VTTFREFWARSAHFGQNGDWNDSCGAHFLSGKPCNLSATSQRPIFTKFGHEVTKRSSVSRRGIRNHIFKNFHFRGHLPAKSEIENRSNRHLTRSRLQVTWFTPRCSPRAREFPRLVNFSLRRMVAELLGVKVAQFYDFGLFSPYKTTKTYLPVISLQPRGYTAE